MQETLSAPKTTPTTQLPEAKAINEAFQDAMTHVQTTVIKVIICANLLIEQRDSMNLSHTLYHSEKGHSAFDRPRADSNKFSPWLKANCPQISLATAYRWMDSAKRIFLKLGLGPVDGVSLSAQLADETSDAFNDLNEYMAGKTLRAAAASAVIEGDESYRALNGVVTGGSKGESRNDYPLFVSKHLIKINTNLENWDDLAEKKPAVAQEMADAMRKAIMGGPLRIDRSGATQNVNGWPDRFCKLINDLTNERLRQKKTKQ